jgi:predicted HicB family RNase H-like nuclease
MILHHGNYLAAVWADEEDGVFVGRVINAAGPITFEGRDLPELQREFAHSVAVYEEVCREEDIEPMRPYSGKFIVRVGPDQHARVAAAAAAAGKSMNAWAAAALARAAERELEPA